MYSSDQVKKFLVSRTARPSSSGVIIENQDGQALVVKASYKTYWSFAGGWIEDTETPVYAALRELHEEVGLTLTEDQVEFAYMIDRISSALHSYQFIFRSKIILDQANIKLQESEITDYKYVSKSEVLANQSTYGEAVCIWARDDQAGYFEQRID